MITNISTKQLLSHQELVCKTFFSQALGLMFRRKQNVVMIFPEEKKISLHMFFVFYPIDVLIVGADMQIKEIKRNFKPFTFWNSKEDGKYVVELGLQKENLPKVGDILAFN